MSKIKEDKKYCCYGATVSEFLAIEDVRWWINEMMSNFKNVYPELGDVSNEQKYAWEDCFYSLQHALQHVNKDFYLIFEYRLKYEGGRRPDVILLTDTDVVILEFKQGYYYKQAYEDQVKGYVHDIKYYHCESREMTVKSVVVLGHKEMSPNIYKVRNDVQICGIGNLEQYLRSNVNGSGLSLEEVNKWLASDSTLLPSITEASQDVFVKQLERLQQVSNPELEDTFDYLVELSNAHWANLKRQQDSRSHMVVFITGVPGAGKTLLAMRLVQKSKVRSIYVSGNGPLLKVLSYTVNKAYEEKVGDHVKIANHYFKNVYNFEFEPSQYDIVAFDEGQRVWNVGKMQEKRKTNISEADLLLQNLETNREKAILYVFVGEGQAIHSGEENNISLWLEALNRPERAGKWKIVCPPKLDDDFKNCPSISYEKNRELLDIKTSIRQHRVKNLNVGELMNTILDAPYNIQELQQQANEVSNNFNIYLTQDLALAKKYCEEVYEKSIQSRYGLIASSKGDKLLKKFGVDCSFDATKNFDAGAWYYENKGKPGSCCNFEEVATEFATQGLELDMPIVCWSNDLKWHNGWAPTGKNEQEMAYRINTYRVLLTRGRDGLIIYVPNDDGLQAVYEKWKEILGESRILEGDIDGHI